MEPDVERLPSAYNWWTVAQVFGVSLLASLAGTLASSGLLLALGIRPHAVRVHAHMPRLGLRIAAWAIWLIVSALIAYLYGRLSRRQLPIGYVFFGWLLWPAWGAVFGLVVDPRHALMNTLWALFTAVAFTLATRYGVFCRPTER